MGFQTGPEDSHERCEDDVFWQTVPDTSSGDQKSLVIIDSGFYPSKSGIKIGRNFPPPILG